MTRTLEMEVKVGLFVVLGVGLVMISIMMLGGGKALFQSNRQFYTRFPQIEGLVEGANVKIAGIRVGQVEKVNYIADKGYVEVHFSVSQKFKDAVRTDSIVGIQTQGVLGDRFLTVSTGTLAASVVENGAELKGEQPKDIKDYLTNADAVIDHLRNSLGHIEGIVKSFQKENRAESFFKNLTSASGNINHASTNLNGIKKSVDHLNSVLAKVDRGEGTVGALINDPSLYEDLKALLGGANRNKVLKYFIRKSVDESREERETAAKK